MAELTRQYAKFCELEDFSDPEIAGLISEIAPDLSSERPHRKGWEFAMGALFLRDVHALRSDATVLDVGAGTEPMLFWLARRVGKVVAVDIYGQGEFRHREAQGAFPDDPAAWAPYEFPRDRLDAHVMDARQLEFADESFDAVVSFSSIEHFGTRHEIAQTSREIGRVLRPGGHAFLVTEGFVRQHPRAGGGGGRGFQRGRSQRGRRDQGGRLSAGVHRLELSRAGGSLRPGDTPYGRLLEIVLAPAQDAGTQRRLRPADWRTLCGQAVDWIEIRRL